MKVINLTEPMPTKIKFYQLSQWPLWALAFRPFFLAAGALAVFLVLGGIFMKLII